MNIKQSKRVLPLHRAFVLVLGFAGLSACSSNYYGGNAASQSIYSTQQETIDLRAEVETARRDLARTVDAALPVK